MLAPFDIIHHMFLPWRGKIDILNVKNYFVTDAVTQYIPYRLFAEESFREDGYVGWNPLAFTVQFFRFSSPIGPIFSILAIVILALIPIIARLRAKPLSH